MEKMIIYHGYHEEERRIKRIEEAEKEAEKEMKKVWRSLIKSFYIVFILYQLLVLYREIDKVSNIREVTATVSYKESIGGDTYLVFTADQDGNVYVYEITNSLFYARYDTSEVYAAVKPGCTYRFTVGGSRNTFLSVYPNIYKYELVEGNAPSQ